jgi:DNA sulfur modification protein DndC
VESVLYSPTNKPLSLPLHISSFFAEKFNESVAIFENLYAKNKRWIITYSGGKDSTALVVLALHMKEMHPDIDLNITYADTLLEIPQMSAVADAFLKGMEARYPAKVRIVYPDVNDTYWVRMIGRGYPPPGPRFRWCTDKIKIKPSRKLHDDNGLFITGLRLGESKQRDVRIKNTCLNGGGNECGGDMWMNQQGIEVAAPIIHWTTDDVWSFLAFSAKKVVPEVQYVIDLYGNTTMRFGCWMCTVVKKDKTLMALSAHGDITSKKLLEFREWLSTESRKDENRYFRKNGVKGRLRKELRLEIVKRLKTLETETRMKLITDREIRAAILLIRSGKYEEYC